MSKRITISGVAYNGKDGALIKTSDGTVFYMEGLNEWPSQYINQTLEVTGIHTATTFENSLLQNEKGEHLAGNSGTRHSLSNISFKTK